MLDPAFGAVNEERGPPGNLPEQRTCGVCVVDLRRGETIALLESESGVPEGFAVAVLPRRFPDLINEEQLLESSLVVPAECHGEDAPTVRALGPA